MVMVSYPGRYIPLYYCGLSNKLFVPPTKGGFIVDEDNSEHK